MPEAISLNLSCVFFHESLPQMRSNLYKHFVHALQFQNFPEIKPKNWFSDSFYQVFCLCPLKPYELYPIFPKLIYTIVVSFISIACGFQVKNFQSLTYQFSTHEMALSGFV